MANQTGTNPYSLFTSRPDMIAAVFGFVGLFAVLFFLQSVWILIGIVILVIGGIAFQSKFEYIPLVVFLQLAFSFELQITSSTRLTLPTEVLIPILFLAYGISVIWTEKITYRPSAMNIFVILMYIVMVTSLRHSLEPISTIKAIIRDTGYIVSGYFLIPRYIRTEKHLRQIIYGCLGLHTLLILYGFITQIVGGMHIYGNIAQPFFIEHCIYAAFITITFSFLLAFYLESEAETYRVWLGILCLLFGIAIILTFVRAAWISVIFLLFFYLFQFRKKKNTVDLILVLIVIFLVGIGMLFTTDLGTMLLQRLSTITETNYTANLDRIDRWVAAWRMWGDHPYLGVGWGAYPDQYFIYAPYKNENLLGFISAVPYSSAFRMGAHNIYLEILAEVGVVGLVIYLLMIYMFFRNMILLQRQCLNKKFYRTFLIGCQGAMITYLVHSFVNNLGPSDKISITFWFLLGIIPTLEMLLRIEKSKENAEN